jgi:hypothetical protein
MKVLVALLVCVLLLSLFSFLVVTLADWIGPSAFFHSPLWLKLKVPAIIIGVLGCLVLLFAHLSHSNRKALQAHAEYAEAQGWSFSRQDTLGLKARVEALFYDQQFDVNTVRTIETGAKHLYLFDCHYHFRGGKSTRGRFGTASLIQSDAFKRVRSPVLLCERIWTDAWLLSDQVDMGDSPFARAFIVQSKDSVGAKETLNGSVQAILFEHLNATNFNPVEVDRTRRRGVSERAHRRTRAVA